jgi:hypothetical protein
MLVASRRCGSTSRVDALDKQKVPVITPSGEFDCNVIPVSVSVLPTANITPQSSSLLHHQPPPLLTNITAHTTQLLTTTSDFICDLAVTQPSTCNPSMDSNRATYPPSGGKALTKAEKQAQKWQSYKRGRSSRRQRNKFPNYGRHRSPQQELIKPYGGELDDGMELDKADGEEEDKAKDMEGDKESSGDGKIYNTPLRKKATITYPSAKADAANTLAELRRRHDELAEYIKETKKSIALDQEALLKDKARHIFQQMRKKQQQDAAVKKEDEMGMDIDIS